MVITDAAHATIPITRLLSIDLRALSEEQMAALTSEAMRRGCSMTDLLSQLVDEMSRRILNPQLGGNEP